MSKISVKVKANKLNTRNAFKDLWKVLRLFLSAHRRQMYLGAFMAGATVVSGIALLGLSGWFITATAVAGLIPGAIYTFNVFGPSASIRFLAIVRTALRYGERVVTHNATLGVIAKLRESLFRGWAKPQAARELLKRPAQLLFRLTVDIDALDALYLRVIVPIAAALMVTVLASFAFSLWLTPWLGLALLVWLLCVGIGVPFYISLKGQRSAQLKAYSIEALRARSVDLVAGQVEMLMAGQIEQQYDAIMKADAHLCKSDNEMNKLEISIGVAHSLATLVMVAGFLLVFALRVEGSLLEAPIAAFALLVLLTIFEPFTAMQRGAVEFGRTLLAVKRLAPRLVEEQDEEAIKEEKTGSNILQPDVVLNINNVSFRYPEATKNILNHVNLELKKGSRIAIVGSSGSGKSTLLSLIAQELEPSEGEIASLSFSVLTQRTELFQDTVRDNLRLANAAATDAELWGVLSDAGLEKTIQVMPKGLDTWLGEGGLGLSGGQARRLALARLLLRKAPLWLLDEPTEGLDFDTAQDILNKISAVKSEQTMLIATHLQREAEIADFILVVDENQLGGLLERGSRSYLSALSQLKPK